MATTALNKHVVAEYNDTGAIQNYRELLKGKPMGIGVISYYGPMYTTPQKSDTVSKMERILLNSGGVQVALFNLQQNEEYKIVRERLETIMKDDEYDDDFIRPTIDAFAAALDLLKDAALRLGSFARALVAPDGEGGIRIEWRLKNGDIVLVVPPAASSRKTLFHSTKDGYAVEEATPVALAKWLVKIKG